MTTKRKKIQLFKVIEYLTGEADAEQNTESYDIVPSTWVEYVPSTGTYLTKFPEGPYTKKRSKLIHSMVRNCQEPFAVWPIFEIDIRGEGETYKRAEEHLRELKYKKYGFTTDENEKPDNRIKRIKNTYRLEQEKRLDSSDVKAIFKVPDLNQEFEKEGISDVSEETSAKSSSSSSESLHIREKEVAKKRKKINKKKKTSEKNTLKCSVINKETTVTKDNLAEDIKVTQAPQSLPGFSGEKEVMPLTSGKIVEESITSNHAQPHKTLKSSTNDTLFASHSQNGIEPLSFQNPSEILLLDDLIAKNNEYENNLIPKIFEKLENQEHEIRELKLAILKLQSLIEGLCMSQRVEVPSLNLQYNIDLPVITEEGLKTLQTLLEKNDSFKKEFSQSLCFYMDRENVLSRSITNILKKVLSREIAILFTASKQTESKRILKGTPLCKCMLDVIANHCKNKSVEFSEKQFYKKLGTVLSNAKDWDGFLQVRKKKLAMSAEEDQQIEKE